MKNFTQVVDMPQAQRADTNEVVGILLASACLALACGPLLKGVGERIAKGGDEKKEGGATFWDWLLNRKKGDPKEEEPKKGTPKKGEDEGEDEGEEPKKGTPKKNEDNDAFNRVIMIAKQANQTEKDKHTKDKNDSLLKLLVASSFDKDGNEIPLDQRIEALKGNMTPEQFEAFKKDMTETYEKNKDNQEFKDALKKAHDNIKPEEYDKMMEGLKKEAAETHERLEKDKKAIEDFEKAIKDAEDELAEKTEELEGEEDPEKKSKLKKLVDKAKEAFDKLKSNPPQTMAAAATGVAVAQAATTEPAEPKQLTKEEIDAKHKEIEDDYKEKSENLEKEYNQKEKDLEKEYKDKIDAEKDEDKKKELEKELKDKKEANEAEWMKKEKALSAAKNKAKDEVDDNDEHDTEKDETKKGKYKVKEEEIEDENGNKIKVKTYTGPRGGKFYYPEGKPKTPENKVYVESLKPHSLTDYLLERLG